MGVFAGEAVRVLVHVARTDQDRTSSFEALDGGRVAGGRCVGAVDFGAGAGGDACHVEQIFGGKRDASERREVAALGARGVDGQGAGAGSGGDNAGERAQLGVARVDCLERGFNLGRCRGLPVGDAGCDVTGGLVGLVHWASPGRKTGAASSLASSNGRSA